MSAQNNFNLRHIDNLAHKLNKGSVKKKISPARDDHKVLSKSSTWENVKQRRKDGDPLMENGGHGRDFVPETIDVIRNGELRTENKSMRNDWGKR